MKYFSLTVLCAAALLAGCESMPSRVQERFAAVPPKVQTFAAPQDKVYLAAQHAFRRLDFTLTRTRPSQVEAVSRINTSAAFADSRQMSAVVHLTPVGPGQTDVEVTLREEVVSKSFGGTRQQDLREHSFFALYFATLQQVLQDEGAMPPVEKR